MESIILVLHVLLAAAVITLVLIQRGKGADMGAAFGSGASGTVFGARGSGSFLTRLTTLFVTMFFATSIALFYLASNREEQLGSVTEQVEVEESVVIEEASETTTPENPEIPVIDSDTGNTEQ